MTTPEIIAIIGGGIGFIGGIAGFYSLFKTTKIQERTAEIQERTSEIQEKIYNDSTFKLLINGETSKFSIVADNNRLGKAFNDNATHNFVKWFKIVNLSNQPVTVKKIEIGSFTTDIAPYMVNYFVRSIKEYYEPGTPFNILPITLTPYAMIEGYFILFAEYKAQIPFDFEVPENLYMFKINTSRGDMEVDIPVKIYN